MKKIIVCQKFINRLTVEYWIYIENYSLKATVNLCDAFALWAQNIVSRVIPFDGTSLS